MKEHCRNPPPEAVSRRFDLDPYDCVCGHPFMDHEYLKCGDLVSVTACLECEVSGPCEPVCLLENVE